MFSKLNWYLRYPFILAIWAYQRTLRAFIPPCCRFTPSCSEYALEAFQRFGMVRGLVKTMGRLLRCHPFHPGGYDPVR